MAEEDLIAQFTTPSQRAFGKRTYDIQSERLSDARYIGAVRLNHTRINAFSALRKDDDVDHFSFKVHSRGELRIGMTDDPNLRVELINSHDKVLADNDANSGELFKKFLEFNEGGARVPIGDYYLRVSRIDDSGAREDIGYSLQLTMGDTSKVDLDTIEYTAKKIGSVELALTRATPPARVASVMGARQLISDGMINFIAMITNGGYNNNEDLF